MYTVFGLKTFGRKGGTFVSKSLGTENETKKTEPVNTEKPKNSSDNTVT